MDETRHDELLQWAKMNVELYYEMETEWEKENRINNYIWELEHELDNRRYGWRNMNETTEEILQNLNRIKNYKRLKYGFRNSR